MEGSTQQPRRQLQQLSLEGLVDLDSTVDLGAALQSSPLSLLSPNALPKPCESPAVGKAGRGGPGQPLEQVGTQRR